MTTKSSNKKFKWALEFNAARYKINTYISCTYTLISYKTRNKTTDIPIPPGYNPSIGHNHVEVAQDTDQNHLILKKSWDLALGPIKQVIYVQKKKICVQIVFVY